MKNYYINRKKKIIKRLHKILKLAKPSILKNYNIEYYQKLLQESNQELKNIIPAIPYVGGKDNMFSIILEVNACIIAVYKTMKENGKELDTIIQILCDATESFFHRFPKFIRKIIGKYILSKVFVRKLTNLSNQTQKRQYSDNWIFTVEKGDDKDYRWKSNYTQCAVVEFWSAQQLSEFLPYCCFFDVINSKNCYGGMVFESTIGQGSPHCIASVKKGRKTEIPEILKKYIK